MQALPDRVTVLIDEAVRFEDVDVATPRGVGGAHDRQKAAAPGSEQYAREQSIIDFANAKLRLTGHGRRADQVGEQGITMLDRFETTLRVRGGARLEGSVATHGAKNAALPIMAAALLAKGTVTLHRVPRITDVSVMWSLLEALGARIRYEGDNTDHDRRQQRRVVSRAVRAGPQAGRVVRRRRRRCWAVSGAPRFRCPAAACSGTRATDMHEQAFVALGCEVRNAHGYLIAESRGRRLHGATVEFRLPSVGATKNAMLAACSPRA